MTSAMSMWFSFNSVLQPLNTTQLPLLKGEDYMKFNCQTHSQLIYVSLHLEICLVNAQVPKTETGMG